MQPHTTADALPSPERPNQQTPAAPGATSTIATATRALRRLVIDGRDNDEAWRRAQPITSFRQFSPVADGDARFRTEGKVACDDQNFGFIRMYDPLPESSLRLPGRRDVRVAS